MSLPKLKGKRKRKQRDYKHIVKWKWLLKLWMKLHFINCGEWYKELHSSLFFVLLQKFGKIRSQNRWFSEKCLKSEKQTRIFEKTITRFLYMVQLGSKTYRMVFVYFFHFFNSQILLLDDCHLSYIIKLDKKKTSAWSLVFKFYLIASP
jgi:hypothetical protein